MVCILSLFILYSSFTAIILAVSSPPIVTSVNKHIHLNNSTKWTKLNQAEFQSNIKKRRIGPKITVPIFQAQGVEDIIYYVVISLGRLPLTHVPVVLSTGSAVTWVNKRFYEENTRLRTSYPTTPQNGYPFSLDLTYEDGSNIQMEVINEKVSIDKLIIHNQKVGVASNIQTDHPGFLSSGVLGMGRSPISPNFIENLVLRKLVPYASFGIFFAREFHGKSTLTLGGYDSLLAQTPKYHKIIDLQSWTLQLDKIIVNKKVIDLPRRVVIDTSTPYIFGPFDDMCRFISAIKTKSKMINPQDDSVRFLLACEPIQPIDVNFVFGDDQYRMSQEDLIRIRSGTSVLCRTPMVGVKRRTHWTLG